MELVYAIRNARLARQFGRSKAEAFKSACEDLDRNAGAAGAGDYCIAYAAVIAAFGE
jgi:hypothetical protein